MNTNKPSLQNLLDSGTLWCPGIASSHLSAPSTPSHQVVPFQIPQIDSQLPDRGLRTGCIHEWFLEDGISSREKYHWCPPLSIIALLISNAATCNCFSNNNVIVWIGRRCWPTPHLLRTITEKLDYKAAGKYRLTNIFIDPPNRQIRLWAIIQALRSPAVLAVAADGSGFDIRSTRRLQLSAEKTNCLGMLVRPPWEIEIVSAASSRWRVKPIAGDLSLATSSQQIYWSLELLQIKGGGIRHGLSRISHRIFRWNEANENSFHSAN